MSDKAPAYRDPVLHFGALRLVALRKGGMILKVLAAVTEREMLIRAPAHVHSAHAALCCWSKLAAHSQPALRTGLMAPAWRPALCIWGVILDLTCAMSQAAALSFSAVFITFPRCC